MPNARTTGVSPHPASPSLAPRAGDGRARFDPPDRARDLRGAAGPRRPGRDARRAGGRQPLIHARRRPHEPGERDLADERGCRPAGRPPVAADASAAATARSHAGSSTRTPPEEAPNSSARPSGIRSARSSTAAISWNRRSIQPGRLPASRPLRAADERLDLDREGSPPRARQARWPRPARRSPLTSRPVGSIPAGRPPASRTRRSRPRRRTGSCRRDHPQARTGGRRRSRARRRPRARACADRPGRRPSSRGPSAATAMPSALASPTRASVHSRTWAGPPGSCVPAVSRRVWIESTASRKGRSAEAVASTCARSRPGANRTSPSATPEPPGAGRDLGVGFLARTPPGTRCPAAASRPTTCSSEGRLADARLAARAARPSRARGRRRAPGPDPREPREDAVDLGVADRRRAGAPWRARRRPPAGGRPPRPCPIRRRRRSAHPLGGLLPAVPACEDRSRSWPRPNPSEARRHAGLVDPIRRCQTSRIRCRSRVRPKGSNRAEPAKYLPLGIPLGDVLPDTCGRTDRTFHRDIEGGSGCGS